MFFDLRLSRSKSAALGPVSQQQEGHTFHFSGCLEFLLNIASKGLEILQIILLNTTLLFYLLLRVIYWIIFKDIQIWHF